LDGAIKPRAGCSDGAACDSRNIFERHIEVEIEDHHEPILVPKARDRTA
jgi:hypothetical protein